MTVTTASFNFRCRYVAEGVCCSGDTPLTGNIGRVQQPSLGGSQVMWMLLVPISLLKATITELNTVESRRPATISMIICLGPLYYISTISVAHINQQKESDKKSYIATTSFQMCRLRCHPGTIYQLLQKQNELCDKINKWCFSS